MKGLKILLLLVVLAATFFLSSCSLPFFNRNLENDGMGRGSITQVQ